MKYDINKELKSTYLGYLGNNKRINEEDELYIEYCLLKGLLHRIDYCSSAGILVEDITKKSLSKYTQKFMKDNAYSLNHLQKFCELNKDKNILVIGSTGIGKTEAAAIWSESSKTFFTLPIRASINSIYDRIYNLIGYKHIGLLHSSALEYLEERNDELAYSKYEKSKNFYQKVTTCTIDQIFPFVFKYKGYEEIYATLSYSKVIIDEIQAYSPEITAIILKGIQMIDAIGGRFMIMTATLPRIYKEELEKMGIKFEYDKFLKPIKRHKIKIQNSQIIQACSEIIQKSKIGKVLIIVNTVNKASEIYLKLKENESNSVQMLHSRFIFKDRNKKEEEIKKFSEDKKQNGIWITTQIVETSLDIDFDYLYTEMSTLDSFFQRLGRCYRNRELLADEPNVYVYTKNVSGIKKIYDEEIHMKSIQLLSEYNNQILTEEIKVQLVDELYSKEMISSTNFYKKFKNGMKILDDIVGNEISKSSAQKLLRNIQNVSVIPKAIYDDNLELFSECREQMKEKNYEQVNIIKRKINKLTTNISIYQASKFKEYISHNKYNIDEIKVIDLEYNSDVGLILECKC